ncbi:hydrogenase maturation nickel metallochaperone HypA [Rhodomicrobium sp. Az07]|nr:hydrogenase maturation nickel metallochaperone HypA [Rhodomicrobium sp. Az07]MBT3072063.1 hydrogenase maturation nickel metallochaperone HypA [Rhodomicrobium sp. Az07]
MHEMALAQGVVRILEEQAAAQHYSRVRVVRLEIGPLATVEPQALRFCFDAATRGTIAENAALDIVETAAVAWCFACGESVIIKERSGTCPSCGSFQLQVTGGDELRIRELEVD